MLYSKISLARWAASGSVGCSLYIVSSVVKEKAKDTECKGSDMEEEKPEGLC